MSAAPQVDWFSTNAPSQPSTGVPGPPVHPHGDWFANKAPLQGASTATNNPAAPNPEAPLGPNAQPIQMAGESPLQRAYEDVKGGHYARAAHDVISSAASATAPLGITAGLVTAPMATVGALAGGALGQQGGEAIASAAGASSDTQNLAGDVGALAGGAIGGAVAPKITEAAGKAIPSTKRAGATMGALREEIGTHPVEITDELSKSLSRYQELVDNGNTPSVTVNKLLKRVTDPEKGDLTYSEARDFATKLGEMTANEESRLSPTIKRQIGQVQGALRDSIADTADRAGKLDQFRESNREYRNAKTLQNVVDWAKDFSLKGIAKKAGATGALYELKKLIGD